VQEMFAMIVYATGDCRLISINTWHFGFCSTKLHCFVCFEWFYYKSIRGQRRLVGVACAGDSDSWRGDWCGLQSATDFASCDRSRNQSTT